MENIMSRGSEPQLDALLKALVQETARLCRKSNTELSTVLREFEAAYRDAAPASDQVAQLGSENSAAQVLSTWHERAEFLDEAGSPRALTTGEGSEFEHLCRAANPVANAQEVLSILAASGAVQTSEGSARAIRRRVMLACGTSVGAARVIRLTRAYFRTLVGNTSVDQSIPRRFERTVATSHLSPKQLPALIAYLAIHGQAFLEDLDGWITAREVTEDGQAVGVGLYLFTE
ncbi:MAG: hypothetical protein ACK52I_32830 [Pseudomonadota bacterium]